MKAGNGTMRRRGSKVCRKVGGGGVVEKKPTTATATAAAAAAANSLSKGLFFLKNIDK